MNIAAVIFAGLCLFAMLAGVLYIEGVSHSSGKIVDSYGNSLNASSQSTANLVENVADTSGSGAAKIILIVAAIIVCVVIAGAYAVSKVIT